MSLRRVTRLERERDVDGLVRVLESGWWLSRAVAANALAAFRGKRVAAALTRALEDRNGVVRYSAARSLAAVEPGALRDRDVSADEIVASGLWTLEGIDAGDKLIAALPDADAVHRGIYLHALGEVGDPKAIPVVEGYLDDEHEAVRLSAAETLERLRP